MAKKLLIVESPAKASTIKKYLGKDYSVIASMGHIIDLPKSQMGVDIENNFEPKYITIRGKGELLTKLRKEAKSADTVYLATDPDREGEAISWHLAHALGLDENSKCRVTFNEITKNAVKNAIKEPREIDMKLVDAQQARRVLDRVVGYSISPILWAKVKRGLSAGRVQSVATKLICDKEEEILNFVPKEYWTVEGLFSDPASKKTFEARYYGTATKEIELSDKIAADAVLKAVEGNPFEITSVKNGQTQKNPPPPFTTSTLQQDAARKLSFSTSKTMQTAQTLYEGVNLGGKQGTIGLITYMRTDSLRIADEAQKEAIAYITSEYGKEYLTPRQFKAKKNAQDAHEAIRPTSIFIKPSDIKDKLTPDQFKLYKLIWERFCACQMSCAVYDTMSVALECNGHSFRASGSQMKFKGFTAVYTEGSDEAVKKTKMLPPLTEKQTVNLKSIEKKQHFTQPPLRFTEATLVRELEENGIGRPSTYAPTISTIISRGYIARSKKQLVPTELGIITTDIMANHFKDIVDVDFTASMERKLDDVEDGNCSWGSVLNEFYPNFSDSLTKAMTNIEKVKIKDEESDVICEKCGRTMVYKVSRFGKFLACPGYPECKNTKTIRRGTGAFCPKCGGEILVKTSKRGKNYYGCEGYPKCDFMLWDEPVSKEKCPKCGSLLAKKTGRNAKVYCTAPECDYELKKAKRKAKSEEGSK